MRQTTALLLCLLFALGASRMAAQTPLAGQGKALFESHCASCHVAGSDDRIPTVAALSARSSASIVDALEAGAMREQGEALSPIERRAIAEFLTGRATPPSSSVPPVVSSDARGTTGVGRCAAAPPWDPARTPSWNGWSPGVTNTRFQTAAQAGLTPATAPRLVLKWAFGLAGASAARGLPTVVGGRVFVGGEGRSVYSLDARSGCAIWTFEAAGNVRSAVVVGPRAGGGHAAYFGDQAAVVYAVDAESGALVWRRKLDDHPFARITGSPTLHEDRLYVPVSSVEEGQGLNAKYECCTFRGSVVSLSTATGAVAWQTHTMGAAEPVGKNRVGTPRWGPSGAAIWSAPTVDVRRRRVYASTGNMYTEPQQKTSDAVIAFNMDSGAIDWVAQLTPKDVFVVGCGAQPGPNCPDGASLGPDFDFGNSPMLATAPGGRELLVIGQKSGIGWALDPDKQGAVVWQYRAGLGSALGGMEWGSAADAELAYFPLADVFAPEPGGLHAVRITTGERAWHAPPPRLACGARSRGCHGALSAAVTVIPGVVFAGSQDGAVRAHSTRDGSVIWQFDTNRDFTTVNGVAARGGSINGPGPVVAGGMLYINSGYGAFGARAGNVLLAFGIE